MLAPAIWLVAVLVAPTVSAEWSEIKADEEIVLFTTMGSRAGSGAGWTWTFGVACMNPTGGVWRWGCWRRRWN